MVCRDSSAQLIVYPQQKCQASNDILHVTYIWIVIPKTNKEGRVVFMFLP